MNSYRNISIWENTRRIEVLQGFRNNVGRYFNNCVRGIENTEAVQARRRINSTVTQAQRIIGAGGIPQIIMWPPSPMVGGNAQQIDVLLNLFELDSFQIPHKRAVDLIERALWVYQSDQMAALRRTINPLWWLFRGLFGLSGFRSFSWVRWVMTRETTTGAWENGRSSGRWWRLHGSMPGRITVRMIGCE